LKTIRAADLFCGAGGTSEGAREACVELGYSLELTAINHWDIAVATHSQNHPTARHLCASLDSINPRDLYGDTGLDLLWASPECTHHSIARGGKPVSDQSRATAWCVVRWAEALRPPIILVENVKEFESWGPIGTNGMPLKSRRGEVFMSWVRCLEALGYRVEWRVLCAADYGDPTTRERLFIYAVRGHRKIVWPEPSHAPEADNGSDMFASRKRWVPARDIIDWTLQGKSIFKRKKPLAEKTLNRILIGLEKFGLKPFTIHMRTITCRRTRRNIDRPLQTISFDAEQ
jgi:DNA (cytosine-5)-methyltransferase 1